MKTILHLCADTGSDSKPYCETTKHANQSESGKMYVMDGFEFLDPAIDQSLGLGRIQHALLRS